MVPKNPPQNDPGDGSSHPPHHTGPAQIFPDVAISFSTTQDLTPFLGQLTGVQGADILTSVVNGVVGGDGSIFSVVTVGLWTTPAHGNPVTTAARVTGLSQINLGLTVVNSARVFLNGETLQNEVGAALADLQKRIKGSAYSVSGMQLTLSLPSTLTTVINGNAAGVEDFTLTIVENLGASGGIITSSLSIALDSAFPFSIDKLDLTKNLFPGFPGNISIGTFVFPLAGGLPTTAGALIAQRVNPLGLLVLGQTIPTIAIGGAALAINFTGMFVDFAIGITGIIFSGGCAIVPAVPTVKLDGPNAISVDTEGGTTDLMKYVVSVRELQQPVAIWTVDDGTLQTAVTGSNAFAIGDAATQLTNFISFPYPPGKAGATFTRNITATVTGAGGIALVTQSLQVVLRVTGSVHKNATLPR